MDASEIDALKREFHAIHETAFDYFRIRDAWKAICNRKGRSQIKRD